MDSYSMEEVTFSFFQQSPDYIHLRILLPRFFPEERREVRLLCKTYLNIISISNSTFQPQKFTNFHGSAGDVSGLYQVLICLRNVCTIESVFPLCDLALFRESVQFKCQRHSRVQLSFYLCTTKKLKYFKPSLNLNLRRQEEIPLVPRISQEQYSLSTWSCQKPFLHRVPKTVIRSNRKILRSQRLTNGVKINSKEQSS